MFKDTLQTAPFVKLSSFSGPLDLLLQLIHKQEMDIFQIDIYQITCQYVEYLRKSPQADLEKAGDFIRMASLLLYIKSKSLIPKEEEREEQESTFEMKEKLSQMLFTYQKFQKAGELLYSRPLLGKDCWKSPRSLSFKNQENNKIQIDQEKGQFQLIQAYHKNLMNKKAKESHKIKKPIPTLLHRLKQIAEVLTLGSKLKFSQLLLVNKEPHSQLMSFLSLLELSKKGFVSLFQKRLFSNIEIHVKKNLTREAMESLSYEEEKISSQEQKEESCL